MFRFKLNQNNTNLSCSRLSDFFLERIDKVTNSVLDLINHLAEDNEFRGKIKMIKNEMECLTEAMSQLNLQMKHPTFNLNYQNFTNLVISKLAQMEKIAENLIAYSSSPKINITRASNCKIQLDGISPTSYVYASSSADNLQRHVFVGASSGERSKLDPRTTK